MSLDETPLTPAAFAALHPVSRETLARLERYAELLRQWQPAVNLVGPSTLPDLWRRHILDSAQLHALLPEQAHVIDIGSGAGFPGLVLAILGVGQADLIESDARKCAFLREAARLTHTAVTVHTKRIEAVTGLAADVVTARALAPLDTLLGYAQRLLRADGFGLFLKGERWEEELTTARQHWTMTATPIASVTHPSSIILRVERLRHAGQP